MSDIKLKIRHAKRGNERSIDLSGMGLIEVPMDVLQLTCLESINLSNNRLTNLRNIEQLQNLREIVATNNNIAQLHQELQDMYCLESLNLIGNPIVNQNPQLARIEGNEGKIQEALEAYFSGGGGMASSASVAGLGAGTMQANAS